MSPVQVSVSSQICDQLWNNFLCLPVTSTSDLILSLNQSHRLAHIYLPQHEPLCLLTVQAVSLTISMKSKR